MAPKLTYFKGFKGRAEPIRLLFTLGDLEFEDVRIPMSEWREKVKPTTKFGQLPMLEVDGEEYAQSRAIMRWVGKQTGHYPADATAAFRCDEIQDHLEDIMAQVRPTMYGKILDTIETKDHREAMRAYLGSEKWPEMFANLEKYVQGDFFLGAEMTICDVELYCVAGWLTGGILDGIPTTLLDATPKLKQVMENVGKNAKVQAWNAAHA